MSNEGGKGRFSVLGWIAGIAGSVIAGVAIWALTAEDGPLTRPERPVSPFQIVEIELAGGGSEYRLGRPIRYTAKVTNTGDQAGNDCHVSASPQHSDDAGNVAVATEVTERFGLLPGETKTVRREVPLRAMERTGHYMISFSLSCKLAGSGGLSSSASIRKHVRVTE